ncbi:MAG: hypothetical protein H6625_06480 [Bdellovibrionaceae bacterium]|nr:hypothetical protein [Pseudobdellovibrionaceae bacterium]
MKPNKLTRLAVLGMLGALAVNMSIWWEANESGSDNFASSRTRSSRSTSKRSSNNDRLERCVRNAMNAPRLNEQLFECKIDRGGNEVVVTGKLELTQREDTLGSSTSGKATLIDLTEGKRATEKEKDKDIKKIDTFALHLTAATNENCNGDCEKAKVSKTYYSDKDGKKRKDFSIVMGKDGGLANDTLSNIHEILAVIDDDLADQKRDAREQKKRDRKYQMCTHDAEGFKLDIGSEEFDACVETQLSELSGEDLRKFVNSRLFPYMTNLALTNPEKANEYRSMIESNMNCSDPESFKGCSGTNSNFLAGTLMNFKDFQSDWSKRNQLFDQAHKKLQSDAQYLPANQRSNFIKNNMEKFNANYVDSYVNPRMNRERNSSPIFAEQYNLIERTLELGRPSTNIWGDVSSSRRYNGDNDYGLNFSEDLARASLEALYPEYSRDQRTDSYSRRRSSLDDSSDRIRTRLSDIDRTTRSLRQIRNGKI